MTDKKPENPLAFPRTASAFLNNIGDNIVMDNGAQGMTLRDYFAGEALGKLAMRIEKNSLPSKDGNYEWLAHESYRIADAMLEARAKC